MNMFEGIRLNRAIGRATAIAVLLACSLWACNSTTQTPTTPTPTEKVTETFTGTLNPGENSVHGFKAGAAGVVTTRLTDITPDNTITLGIAVGAIDGVSCLPTIVNGTAKLNSVMVGLATASVTLCVRVFDVGSITAATTYTVTVEHY
jgi:hypothetical protein